MSHDDANDNLMSNNDQARLLDSEMARDQGLKQLDWKSGRPRLGGYQGDG